MLTKIFLQIHKTQFPNLSKMARDFLAIPGMFYF